MNETTINMIYSTIFGICVGTLLFFVDHFTRKIILPRNIVLQLESGPMNLIFIVYYLFIIFFIFHTIFYFLHKNPFLT
jgi:hypothetical protein